MSEIFVLVEHRQGKIRDITYEMLGAAEKLAAQQGAALTAVLLGKGVHSFAEELATRVPKILVVEDENLENFNSALYQQTLSPLLSKHRPPLTLIGHTAFGMDLAPTLSVEIGFPLVTDCIDLSPEGNQLKAVRSIYGGKVNTKVSDLRGRYSLIVEPGKYTFTVSHSDYKSYKAEVEIGKDKKISIDK